MLVVPDRSNDRRNIIARFHQNKFSRRRIFRSGQCPGDATGIAGNSQPWRLGGGANQSGPGLQPEIFIPPFLGQIIAIKTLCVKGKDCVGFARQPLAFGWGLKNEQQDNSQKDQDGKNDEIKFSQLLFVDLRGKNVELFPMFVVTLDRLSVAEDIMQQVRGVRRRDSASRKMTTDVEVGGIFSFFDGLVLGFRLSQCLLMPTRLIVQPAVGRVESFADPDNISLRRRKFVFRRRESLRGLAARFSATFARTDNFGALVWQSRSFAGKLRRARIQVRWWRRLCLQSRELP